MHRTNVWRRFGCWSLSAVIAVGSLGQIVDSAEPASQQPGEVAAADGLAEPTQDQLKQWVADLDSDDFFVRQKGTEHLIASGQPAVAVLDPALDGKSLEASTRAIHILQELALSTDRATEDAARTALETTSNTRIGSVARRATSALETLNDLRRERALTDLEKLGAELHKDVMHNGITVVEAVTGVEIGPTFIGKADDLRLLAWIDLPDFQITFTGPTIKDEHLRYLPEMKTASTVQFKRTSVTDNGLSVLPKMGQLNDLIVINTPITDRSFEYLRNCQGLSTVKLYGTKFTRDKAQQLQTALGIAKVDYRVGAFLGVGGQQTLQGCQIGIVQDGSAADKAGLMVGDIIVRVGKKKVADFESLTEIISEYAGGDSVEVELLRNEETLAKKVTFGEWE